MNNTQLKINNSKILEHRTNSLRAFLEELRPKQWTKNILVFAAPLFAFRIMSTEDWIKVFGGFVAFCLISGTVYILNDFVDLEKDKQHPDKRYRPMAMGILSPKLGLILGTALFLITLYGSWWLGRLFFLIILLYFVLNVLYSFLLKHIVIIDVFLITFGFVLRALAGAVLFNGRITPWFLICIMWLALFLAISKRRSEIYLLQDSKGSHRKVLDQYNVDFLEQLISIVTTATIISYSLFTITSGHTLYLMLSIPLVIYGVFRYLYLIHAEGKGGKPEEVLIGDKHILITVILYVITVIVALGFLD
jgi:4-hydroxybenzoate polyprenyltransferase